MQGSGFRVDSAGSRFQGCGLRVGESGFQTPEEEQGVSSEPRGGWVKGVVWRVGQECLGVGF